MYMFCNFIPTLPWIISEQIYYDGVAFFYQHDISICFKYNFLFLGNRLELFGYSQFLEICTAS